MAAPSESKWPKDVPELTAEQHAIKDDWMRRFHEILPDEHARLVRFNNTYPLRATASPTRTLEIGPGLGEHLRYEDLTNQEYYTIELRENMAEVMRHDFPGVQTFVGDCQERLPFSDGFFDRVLAIHVLEHLPDLPRALDEIDRTLRPGGIFTAVIPCEGGLLYSLGRRFTTQRQFERRYETEYKWVIGSEHLSVPKEIFEEIGKRFEITDRTYYPLRVRTVHLNVIIGITARRSAR